MGSVMTGGCPKQYLRSITFRKEWRCFRAGDVLAFQPGLNPLVGDQGCGKSSVLEMIKDQAEAKRDDDRRKLDEIALADVTPVRLRTFDFERDNFRTKGHFEDNVDFGYQVQCRFASHGQSNRPILQGLERFSDVLILLDEPDTALSPRSIHWLYGVLRSAVERGCQLLVTMHNPLLIALCGTVYSLEHRRWMEASEFLALHVTEPTAS